MENEKILQIISLLSELTDDEVLQLLNLLGEEKPVINTNNQQTNTGVGMRTGRGLGARAGDRQYRNRNIDNTNFDCGDTGNCQGRGANRRNERLYNMLYQYYSIPNNAPKSEEDVQGYAMVILDRPTLTPGELNACKDIYNDLKDNNTDIDTDLIDNSDDYNINYY